MQRGKRQRAREGKVVPAGRAPYGFSYDTTTGSFKVVEDDMRIVRRVFDLAAHGTSLHRIRRILESEGIRTPGSTRKPEGSTHWNVNTIRRILLNDVYTGVWHYNRTSRNGASAQRSLRPREEWISIPVPDSNIPKEQIEQARANLKGERQSRADNRFWELSGFAFCACGCKLISKVTHKAGRKYPYYVCSRHTSDGCPRGQWLNADKLEMNVYWALQRIEPQDLEAQIQELIDRERAPESEIRAEYALLERVAQERTRLVKLYTTGKIDDAQYDIHAAELDSRQAGIERRLEILENTTERIEKLKLMQKNPILSFVGQTTDQRRDYYNGLELRVETDKDSVVVKGIFGCQNVAPTSTSVTRR
jgi:hypothetical protein